MLIFWTTVIQIFICSCGLLCQTEMWCLLNAKYSMKCLTEWTRFNELFITKLKIIINYLFKMRCCNPTTYDLHIDIICTYLWNIVLQGSGYALVPNSLTTILCAALFCLYVFDSKNLHWYDTDPFLNPNLYYCKDSVVQRGR